VSGGRHDWCDDGGTPGDAGDGGSDAGARDTGAVHDGGADAAEPLDASRAEDSGTVETVGDIYSCSCTTLTVE
jgi:hypothetical protein